MNDKTKKIKWLTATSILIALTVALQFFSNYISFGNVNINLALIVIIVGACLYGPLTGLILGVVDGIIICVAPSTIAFFMSVDVLLTIVLCLLKTGLAGFLSGIVYKALKNKNMLVASIIASIIVPIVNTSIFIIGVVCTPFLGIYGGSFKILLTAVISINFVIEFVTVSVLSPVIHRLIFIKNNTQD